MTKIQSASGGSNVLNIEYWNLEFICYLGIVIWCFKGLYNETPLHRHTPFGGYRVQCAC
jgi:hypothetical protein